MEVKNYSWNQLKLQWRSVTVWVITLNSLPSPRPEVRRLWAVIKGAKLRLSSWPCPLRLHT